ncbi:MAG TPA: hypothetical protein VKE93_13520 [Candidatus Angelobacter sp.]|nr:hypothetical protein [Candidatus Angelobacter sp.]
MNLSLKSRTFITLVIVLGLCVLGMAIANASAIHSVRFIAFLLVACLAARLKVKLPGVSGNMAVNLPFILVAVAEMTLLEALIVGCLSNLVHCVPSDKRKFNWLRTSFNVCTMALAVGATRLIDGSSFLASYVGSHPLRLAIATAGFFLVNTITIAIVIALTESNKGFGRAWLGIFQLSYPYFLASAGVAGVVLTLVVRVGWQVPVLILPLMAGVFYSYRRFFALPPKLTADIAPGKIGPEGVHQAEKQAHA